MAHAVARAKSDVIAVVHRPASANPRGAGDARAARWAGRWSMFAPGDRAAIDAAQPFAVVLQYPGTTGAIRDLSRGNRRRARGGRPGDRRRRSAGADAADAARRDGRRCRRRLGAALRRADGFRRPACRVFRHARRASSGTCPAAWSASARMPPARRPCGSRCRRASSISAARRRPAISAPRRCCWRSSPASTPSGTGRRGCGASPGASICRRACWPMRAVQGGYALRHDAYLRHHRDRDGRARRRADACRRCEAGLQLPPHRCDRRRHRARRDGDACTSWNASPACSAATLGAAARVHPGDAHPQHAVPASRRCSTAITPSTRCCAT